MFGADVLPVILTANLNQIDIRNVELVYTTQDATRVDILTMFGQGDLSLPANGSFQFTGLRIGIIYSVTIIASDDEGNYDVKTSFSKYIKMA